MIERRRALLMAGESPEIPSRTTYWYYLGDTCASVSGGYEGFRGTGASVNPIITYGTDYISVQSTQTGGSQDWLLGLQSKNAINFNGEFTGIFCYGKVSGLVSGSHGMCYMRCPKKVLVTSWPSDRYMWATAGYPQTIGAFSTYEFICSTPQDPQAEPARLGVHIALGKFNGVTYSKALGTFTRDDLVPFQSYGATEGDILKADTADAFFADSVAMRNLSKCTGSMLWRAICFTDFRNRILSDPDILRMFNKNADWVKAIGIMNS